MPQFHEFRENNEFWGKGFTEWTCLNQFSPLFEGHQIRRPHADIGYYSLVDPQIRKKQGELAKHYGVHGFCYYHYWFGEKPVMELPLELMLQDGYPDLPFCLSWANKSWTRRMNRGDGSVLIKENHGDEPEWERHFNYLVRFFKSRNYILVNNKPLFIVYYPESINRFSQRCNYWNMMAKDHGFDGLFIVATLGLFPYSQTTLDCCDAALEFFPNFLNDPEWIKYSCENFNLYDLQFCYNKMAQYQRRHVRQFNGTMTGFDNSPRNVTKSNVFVNGGPEAFKKSLRQKVMDSTEDFVFIQGWNEWAEGATLEPDDVYGYDFLNAVSDIASISRFYI